jgi:hypothetical protein
MMPTVPEPLPLMLTDPEPPPLMPVAPALVDTIALSGGPPVQPIAPPLLQVSPTRLTVTTTRMTAAAQPRSFALVTVVAFRWSSLMTTGVRAAHTSRPLGHIDD